MGAITVSRQFMADFEAVASHFGWSNYEKSQIRAEIRADFDNLSGWISETAEIIKFKDETFGTALRLPTWKQCQTYMLSRGVWVEDEEIARFGIMILLRDCARLAGRLS